MSDQITGVVSVDLGATPLPIEEDGVTFYPGVAPHEARATTRGVKFKQSLKQPSTLQVNMAHTGATNHAQYASYVGPITVRLDSGQTWLMPGAHCTDPGNLSGGRVSMTFSAKPAVKTK